MPDRPAGLAAAVPAPRPELLVRVLEGLRELPDAPDAPDAPAAPAPVGAAGAGGATARDELLPLPRRRA